MPTFEVKHYVAESYHYAATHKKYVLRLLKRPNPIGDRWAGETKVTIIPLE